MIEERLNEDNKLMTREERALLREKRRYEQEVDSAITISTNEMKAHNFSSAFLLTNKETNKDDDKQPLTKRICRKDGNNDVIKVKVDDIDYESNLATTSNFVAISQHSSKSRRKALFY